MFFGSKKRRKYTNDASHPSEPADNEVGKRHSRQWHAWRRSAQKVTRTWHEWLAADRCDDAEFYRRYTCALDQEERAAVEIEQMVIRETTAQDVRHPAAAGERRVTNR